MQTGGAEDGSGARIDEVMPDTPAADSGLEEGDVVTEVNGQRVTDGISLIVAIRTYQPGETIEFTRARDGDGEEQTLVEITPRRRGPARCASSQARRDDSIRPASPPLASPSSGRSASGSTNGCWSTNSRVSSYIRLM